VPKRLPGVPFPVPVVPFSVPAVPFRVPFVPAVPFFGLKTSQIAGEVGKALLLTPPKPLYLSRQ